MKMCQIATVGENIEWILKGLLLFKANKLILISTSDPNFVMKINEIKNRLLSPKFETEPLEIEEKIIESEDPLEFINVLKKTILENSREGYEIEINATAGLRVWQILGYFTCIQFKNLIKTYFIINKRKGEPIIFPLSILNKTEQLVLDIIGNDKKNIKQIKNLYEKYRGKKVSQGLISKYLTKLKENNLLIESTRDKFKYFKLSELGGIYYNSLTFYDLN